MSDWLEGLLRNPTLTATEKIVTIALVGDLADPHRQEVGLYKRLATATAMSEQAIATAISRLSGRNGLFSKRVTRVLTQYGWESCVVVEPRFTGDALAQAVAGATLVRPNWGGKRSA